MRDMHLTLRLSRELARAVARWARAHGVPKSQVVRDAVAAYVGVAGAGGATIDTARTTPARSAAARWASLPHLTPKEAGGLAGGIAASRTGLPSVESPWE